MKPRSQLLGGRPPGQTLAEFAQVATVFLLLIFGMMEMGIVVYRYTTICMAAREAARYAMVHGPNSQNPDDANHDSTIAVATAEAPFLSAGDVTVTFPTDQNLPKQQDALVSITHNYTQQIPFMSPVTLTLTSSSRMLLSQ
jgi:Flp pilus assembly protein TadG